MSRSVRALLGVAMMAAAAVLSVSMATAPSGPSVVLAGPGHCC